ncbi:unnamed protein product [Scytosiphon promiscuus]
MASEEADFLVELSRRTCRLLTSPEVIMFVGRRCSCQLESLTGGSHLIRCLPIPLAAAAVSDSGVTHRSQLFQFCTQSPVFPTDAGGGSGIKLSLLVWLACVELEICIYINLGGRVPVCSRLNLLTEVSIELSRMSWTPPCLDRPTVS